MDRDEERFPILRGKVTKFALGVQSNIPEIISVSGCFVVFFPYPAPLLRVFIETNGVLFLLPPKKFHPRHDTQKTKITSTYRSKTSPICREEEDWLPAQACDLMLKHFRQSPTQINGCQKTPVGRLFFFWEFETGSCLGSQKSG